MQLNSQNSNQYNKPSILACKSNLSNQIVNRWQLNVPTRTLKNPNTRYEIVLITYIKCDLAIAYTLIQDSMYMYIYISIEKKINKRHFPNKMYHVIRRGLKMRSRMMQCDGNLRELIKRKVTTGKRYRKTD